MNRLANYREVEVILGGPGLPRTTLLSLTGQTQRAMTRLVSILDWRRALEDAVGHPVEIPSGTLILEAIGYNPPSTMPHQLAIRRIHTPPGNVPGSTHSGRGT